MPDPITQARDFRAASSGFYKATPRQQAITPTVSAGDSFNQQFAVALNSKLKAQAAPPPAPAAAPQAAPALAAGSGQRPLSNLEKHQAALVPESRPQVGRPAITDRQTRPTGSPGSLTGIEGLDVRAGNAFINANRGATDVSGPPVGTDSVLSPQGFADGGSVTAPTSTEYDLYRQAAQAAGVAILPPEVALRKMSQIREEQQVVPFGFAEGGAVNVDGAVLEGPGTETSDSIPAIIDGHAPAALSKSEMVIPKHIVDYYGTKFFDTLVEKARQAGKVSKRRGAVA